MVRCTFSNSQVPCIKSVPNPPRVVSEKALELNVCSELLSMFRGPRGTGSAFMVGMKQNQESKSGIDEFIRGLPRKWVMAFQFKSPKPRSSCPEGTACPPMEFTINDRQNNHLLRLAHNRPHSVYYVLPHFICFPSMERTSPRLLGKTWFLRVGGLSGLPSSGNVARTHKVLTHRPNDGWAQIYSDPIGLELTSPGELPEIATRRDSAGGPCTPRSSWNGSGRFREKRWSIMFWVNCFEGLSSSRFGSRPAPYLRWLT